MNESSIWLLTAFVVRVCAWECMCGAMDVYFRHAREVMCLARVGEIESHLRNIRTVAEAACDGHRDPRCVLPVVSRRVIYEDTLTECGERGWRLV